MMCITTTQRSHSSVTIQAMSTRHVPKPSLWKALLLGLRDSLPIGMGYFPIAVSFGVAAAQAHIAFEWIVAISVFVFAGAGQFIMVALLASGASALVIISTVWLINLRHLFYGIALLPKLALPPKHMPLALLAAGLTDEVFATALGKLDSVQLEMRQGWFVGVQLGAYSAWVLGTIVGAGLGVGLAQQAAWIQNTIDFLFPALFAALLFEVFSRQLIWVFVGAGGATVALLLVVPAHWSMLGGMTTGALIGAFLSPTHTK